MRILLDMDGVLADFDAGVFRDLPDMPWPVEAYERGERYCTDYLAKPERKAVRRHIEETHFFRHLPVIDGAAEGVESLFTKGHDLWVCTKPLEANPWCANDKMAWIAEHFPDLVGRVIVAPRKSMIHGDLLLDDAHRSDDLREATYCPVWYRYPHNYKADRLFFTWADSVELLESYAGLHSYTERVSA